MGSITVHVMCRGDGILFDWFYISSDGSARFLFYMYIKQLSLL